jgi:hypothetical protein
VAEYKRGRREKMADVVAWPKPTGCVSTVQLHRIKRPCDSGLYLAVSSLETQLGTIEAYNRLVEAALSLKARIDAGDIKAQNPIYAVSIRGET